MRRWFTRLLTVGVLVVFLVKKPFWVLVALSVPGIVIVEAASAIASRFTANRIDTGVHFSVPLPGDTALGLVPVVAIGFWVFAYFAMLVGRQRRRRSRRDTLKL